MPDYIREAKRARREGDYSKAGDLYFLGGDDKSALDCYLKGNHYSLAARLLEKQEDWKGAAKFYLQSGKYADAAEIYSNHLRDYRTASVVFEKSGDLTRASEMAEKAGDINRAALLADQGEQWERAATLYIQSHKYERAADVYFEMLKQLAKEKNEKGFLADHQAKVTRCGNSAGILYLRLKNYDRAAQCFEEADNLEKAAEAHFAAGRKENAAELYYRLQNYDRSYDILSRLGERTTNKELYADVCWNLKRFADAGDLYMLAGKILRAAESYESAKNYYKAALLYEGFEDYAKAAELYLYVQENKKAAELFEKARNYQQAATVYIKAGLLDRAIQCLVSAGEHLRAANLLIERNEMQRAVSVLQEIRSDQDEYREACILLGHLFTNLEMYSVAQQKFQEAIANQPLSKENIDIYYALAVALEKTAQYSKGREIFERILAVQLGYKDVLERLEKIKTQNLLDGTMGVSSSSVRRAVLSRYELQEKAAQDPLGTIYKAHDTSMDRTVSIRRIKFQDEDTLKLLLEQTRAAATLTHSNILAIYDSGKDGNHFLICTEPIEGDSLRVRMAKGHMEVSEICEMATQICLALGYAHKRGMIHKSLTPENIFVGKGTQVKIANFGIDTKWEQGSTIYFKQYVSPEQIMGQKLDSRADLYALGVILYEAIYGQPPFSGQDVEFQHLKNQPLFAENATRLVPDFLVRIINRCLEKDRDNRYANAEEIVEELEVADIVPGMVLHERYEIIRELGSGGMGRVYQAHDRELDEMVALKMLRAEVSADPVIQKRFVREIKMTRMITHPNVVKVFDIGKYKGNRYISMEYIDGIGLDEWLRKNVHLELRLLVSIMAKIIQGVLAAHAQGIVHRDLKPQNVLLDMAMNPHILDFGIARSKNPVDATQSGQVIGSPKYMSPEQIQGRDLDQRSDIYSLGVMMFFLFTGQEPFTGDEPRVIVMKHLTEEPPAMGSINPKIPAWLERIVAKAMEKDRNQRYSSLKELLDDLKKGYETRKI